MDKRDCASCQNKTKTVSIVDFLVQEGCKSHELSITVTAFLQAASLKG